MRALGWRALQRSVAGQGVVFKSGETGAWETGGSEVFKEEGWMSCIPPRRVRRRGKKDCADESLIGVILTKTGQGEVGDVK